MKTSLKTIDRIFIVIFCLLAIWILFGCRSSKKMQHSESSEVHVIAKDSSKTQVKKSQDTTTKILQVKKDGFVISIKNPVFKSDSNVLKPESNVWTALFSQLTSAHGVEINGSSSDSILQERSGSATYDSTHEQTIAKDSTSKAASQASEKVVKNAGSIWIWFLLIVAAVAFIWFKRGWILSKIFE